MRLDRRHVLLLLVGNFMLAAASGCFLLPAHVIGGGVNGLAVILEKAFQIEPTLCINGMIFACFILGVFFLGRDFALKTIASTLLYPIFLQILSMLSIPVLPPLLASILGGGLTGLGIGLVMRTGGSSGGMDVPPLILNKYFHIPVSIMVLICDSLIVLGGLIVYGWKPVVIGLISVIICSKTLSYTLINR